MIEETQLRKLISDLESDRIERTITLDRVDKFCEAICAFSNDLPNHAAPGYFLIGVTDDGKIAGLTLEDRDMQRWGAYRSDGNILPVPSYDMHKFVLPEGEIAVLEVFPSVSPPVKYKGRIYIRIGPRKGIANEGDERRLNEKRAALAKTFDGLPCQGSSIKDIDTEIFRISYLPQAVAREILEENHRDPKIQLSSLGFFDLAKDCPSYGGLILFSNNVEFFIPGAYIQYVKFNGKGLEDDPILEKKFSGDLVSVLAQLDDFLKIIISEKPVAVSSLKEEIKADYPILAIRELLLNAIMHKDYQSNAPIRFYQFENRIEIQNPGGLYGTATPDNFPNQNDYRNPILAEALKNLGYVNRFSRGIIRATSLLKKNGNPDPNFVYNQQNYFLAIIYN